MLKTLRNSGNSINCEKIVDCIENEIIQGRLRKGDKLPTERKMAEDMEVSRASVREAIKALEVMGIVKSIQGSGNYITDDPDSTVNRPLCALFALNDGTLDNLLQLRIMLEAEACRDIVKNASDEDIAALSKLASYDYDNLPIAEQAVCDSAFHRGIVHMSRNTLVKYLYTTLAQLMDASRVRVLTATADRGENHITRDDHAEIVSALAHRDAAGAVEAVQRHLELNREYREMLDTPYHKLM